MDPEPLYMYFTLTAFNRLSIDIVLDIVFQLLLLRVQSYSFDWA